MSDLRVPFILLVVFLALYFVLGPPKPASGACVLSHCKTEQTVKMRTYITNTHRQKVGDLYDPGTGRIQIRDTFRRIVGYIERSGRVTNTHRQKTGEINE